ncbi:BTAD domain-containing putative transcriptional regulator [Desulfovibrio inopinatus]|uniref:BTAD domain-containing putative transcriptional regulator n=1 Tax=Desulfovibrio inopinatus TaxID=102109 RepID=UPI000425B83D|nr:BTAD domain-containing putative transcriptional regulator [Desulfovibrio inopinatus]
MEQSIHILPSKLAPAVAPDLVPRENIQAFVKAVIESPICLYVAGAGYGKTSLAAQVVEQAGMQTLWYGLDEFDRDFNTFLSYLIAGARQYVPDFGAEILPRLAAPLVLDSVRQSVLCAFASEIGEHIQAPLLIVLDDCHRLGENPDISSCVEFLMERLPTTVHWLLLSRTQPAFRLSLFQSRRQVRAFGEAELGLCQMESDRLCRHLVGESIDSITLVENYRRSRGWAAGIVLLCLASPESRDVTTHETVTNYFEENVLSGLPDELSDFMCKTALLDWMEPSICNAALQRSDTSAVLEQLCRNHVFTFRLPGENSYCYHHLLRDGLRRQAKLRYNRQELTDLLCSFGRILEEKGHGQQALRLYMSENLHDEICHVLEPLVRVEDWASYSFALLSEALDTLPDEIVKRHPRVFLFKARLASIRGNMDQAVAQFQNALHLFRAANDTLGEESCLREIGVHEYFRGNIVSAYENMYALWETSQSDPCVRSDIAGYCIFFASILGKFEAADTLLHEAMGLTAQSGNPMRNFSRLWIRFCHIMRQQAAGHFVEADIATTRSLEAFEAMGAELILPLVHAHSALIARYRRDFHRGKALAEKGLEMVKHLGVFDHQYGWLSYSKARNAIELGDLDDARQSAEVVYDIFTALGHPWGKSVYHELMGVLCTADDDWHGAHASFARGLACIEGKGLVAWQGELALQLARTLVELERYDEALHMMTTNGAGIDLSTFLRFQRAVITARIDALSGRSASADVHFAEAIRLGSQYDYGAWLVEDIPHLVPVLVRYVASEEKSAFIDSVMKRLDHETVMQLRHVARTGKGVERTTAAAMVTSSPSPVPVPLHVTLLGRFTVTLGETPLVDEVWRNFKALTIFKYLALKSESGFIDKDILLELAWPDEDPQVTGKRFHVAMTFLRKLLEPSLQRGQPSSYLLRRDNSYRLETGQDGSIDVKQFYCAVRDARSLDRHSSDEAAPVWNKAKSLYHGPLFGEDPEEDWFRGERLNLHNEYVECMSRLVASAWGNQDWQGCIEHAEACLCVDGHVEPIYRYLMQAHAERADMAAVHDIFERCRCCLQDELGILPSTETKALYQRLVSDLVES